MVKNGNNSKLIIHIECTTCLFILVRDFSILLANRSAALYHMKKYDHALADIELAEETYPEDMMHKLKERSARCYLAKKCYEKALNSFK